MQLVGATKKKIYVCLGACSVSWSVTEMGAVSNMGSVQYSKVQYCTVQYSMVQYSTGTAQNSTGISQHSTSQ